MHPLARRLHGEASQPATALQRRAYPLHRALGHPEHGRNPQRSDPPPRPGTADAIAQAAHQHAQRRGAEPGLALVREPAQQLPGHRHPALPRRARGMHSAGARLRQGRAHNLRLWQAPDSLRRPRQQASRFELLHCRRNRHQAWHTQHAAQCLGVVVRGHV